MLRLLTTAAVLCVALLGLQRRADAHAGCRSADTQAHAVEADGTSHAHHQTHDAPHVPHDEPDGCHHDCLGCSSAAPALAAPVGWPGVPAPAAGAMTITSVDRFPGGPPPARPFQVPRA